MPRSEIRTGRILAVLTLAVAAPGPVQAVDGVVEISHPCAEHTGCFSGDGPGYPVTIDGSAGRNYRLTGDLVLSDENTNGISIDSRDVSIDLNGFTIIGEACVGATSSSCQPVGGLGSGIVVDAGNQPPGVSVRNGSIVGMGQFGIWLADQAQVSGLRVRWNQAGISVLSGSTVSGSTAVENVVGISTGGRYSTVAGNTAYQNTGNGIDVTISTTLLGNTSYQNGSDGFYAGSGSTIRGNTAYGNGDDGIEANVDCLLELNTVRANAGFGLNVVTSGHYRGNVINTNTAGAVGGSGTEVGANVCDGNTTCP